MQEEVEVNQSALRMNIVTMLLQYSSFDSDGELLTAAQALEGYILGVKEVALSAGCATKTKAHTTSPDKEPPPNASHSELFGMISAAVDVALNARKEKAEQEFSDFLKDLAKTSRGLSSRAESAPGCCGKDQEPTTSPDECSADEWSQQFLQESAQLARHAMTLLAALRKEKGPSPETLVPDEESPRPRP